MPISNRVGHPVQGGEAFGVEMTRGAAMAYRKNTKYETSYDASGDKALTWFFVGLGFIALVTALVGQIGGA